MTTVTLVRGRDRYVCRAGACVQWHRDGHTMALLGPLVDDAAVERFMARRFRDGYRVEVRNERSTE